MNDQDQARMSKSLEEQSEVERVLYAHRELCSLSATHSMYRNSQKPKKLVNMLLKIAGLHDRGKLNYLNISAITNRVKIERLPDELNGLRILQLGNLHLPNQDELLNSLFDVLGDIEYDICVLTGGIGLGLHNDALLPKRAERLMNALSGNVYAVLGMGDTVQSMSVMGDMGIIVLNNEFDSMTLMDRTIEIFGAECSSALIDSRFESRIGSFNMADLRLIVAANPQFRALGPGLEYDLMLSGVQSCKHCVYRSSCKLNYAARRLPKVENSWMVNDLQGYTSSGLGRNHLDVRFRSRPELVVHELEGVFYD